MKLKFKKQEYQTEAVNAVVNCFTGQPMHDGAAVGLPSPKVAAICRPRAPAITDNARLCAPDLLAGSCQRSNSSWRTTAPSASIRP